MKRMHPFVLLIETPFKQYFIAVQTAFCFYGYLILVQLK